MRQPRPFNPKKSAIVGSEAASQNASSAGAPLSKMRSRDACNVQSSAQSLAPAGLGGHDSKILHVTDDWPSSVPITHEEVDVIEAFLRREIDALLR
ncbi:hypothetical protein [Ancylobacter sonchi]|uniref:hypothetical protein n=1 Tax=Ancylobacter sonchi TaxID=1937790 RepID=UPI001BD43334|nr:hypothetical protein [Ancylobacter sonchi]